MDNRDSTIARNFGGQGPAHAAGVIGCGNPDRFHRIVEHCQSPLGARFGATTRDGGAVSAGGEPRPHGAPDADRVHAAVAHRRAAGIATAVGTLGFILRFVPSNVPRLNEVRIDWVVLAFALLISILTGLVFGLAPALHSAKGALASAIREGGRGTGYSTKTGRLRDVLIVSELAFAVILMVGAGLLLRTLRDLLQENPGFNPTQVVAANIQ